MSLREGISGIGLGRFQFDASADITQAVSTGEARREQPKELKSGPDKAQAESRGRTSVRSRRRSDPAFDAAYDAIVSAQQDMSSEASL